LDELAATLGDDLDAWRWGDIHRVRFAGPLARVPGLEELFTGGEGSMGGDEQTVLQGMYSIGEGYGVSVVPSWRMVVDLGDLDCSLGVNTLGQSGNPASPHYRDQFPMWLEGTLHPLPFTRGAVDAAAATTLRLVPR
jgi:penicillin amidase